MTGTNKFRGHLNRPVPILPLAIFRMAFGFLLCFSQFRFLHYGWVEECFTRPSFHFTYQFFRWVEPFNSVTMYILVVTSAVLALFVGLGLMYRASCVSFFILFTYLELIEKSWYLNHYYLVSLLAFLLIWVPAHRSYSLDAAVLFKNSRSATVPDWSVLIIKIQIVLVYFFGGLAKLNADWVLHAQPLKIWLQARTDMPLLGTFFEQDISAYLFSWCGLLFDLSIPFLLWNRRTRPVAYLLVVVFHTLTFLLFNIGMFPWIMMGGSLIFVTAAEWKSVFTRLGFGAMVPRAPMRLYRLPRLAMPLLFLYLGLQIGLPLRHVLITDRVLWTENGFRFAWQVMVMEKNGYAEFRVVDHKTNKIFTVYPNQYLTDIQEKQMCFQPDMIWEFAQFLGREFRSTRAQKISVYVDSRVSLNGRPSQVFMDPDTDFLQLPSADAVYQAVQKLEEPASNSTPLR